MGPLAPKSAKEHAIVGTVNGERDRDRIVQLFRVDLEFGADYGPSCTLSCPSRYSLLACSQDYFRTAL